MELRKLQVVAIAIAVAALLVCVSSAHALVQGIDVSHFQGTINWTSVKSAGIQFAFCKATEGVDFEDVNFDTYMNGAIAAGMPIGPYHFARTNSGETLPTDAVDEADDFVAAIQGYYNGPGLVLRPVLDLEQLPNDSVAPLTVKQYVSKWTRDFCNRVTTTLGVAPIIYTSGSFAQTYLEADLVQYPLWFAKPITPTPLDPTDVAFQNNINNVSPPTDAQMGIWSSYTFWQWSWEGAISGISGNVDRDVFNGTLLQMVQQFSPNYSNGDYNNDGVVDSADYVYWRDRVGQIANIGTGADGDLSGIIDIGDYNIWKSNFGKLVPNVPAGAGAQSVVGVPEPATVMLFVAAAATLVCRCRRRTV